MTMRDESEALDAVSKAVNARRTGANRAELTLSNGIVLAIRPVPPTLTNALQRQLESGLPKPPVVYVKDKGRDEENPNDPDYQAELERQTRLAEIALNDLIAAAGMDCLSVPAGMFRPEEDGWLLEAPVKIAREAGLAFDEADPVKRKVAWMRFYALENFVDVRLYNEITVELAGITEEEVELALAAFRGVPGGKPNNGVSPAPAGVDGDRDNRAGRRSRARAGRA